MTIQNYSIFDVNSGHRRSQLSSKPSDVSRLRTFGSFVDVEFDWVTFLQGAIAVADDAGIMNKDVGAVLASNKSITFRIVEPLHGPLHTAFLHWQKK